MATPRPKAVRQADRTEHGHTVAVIRGVLSTLRLTRVANPEIEHAKADLEAWLAKYDEGWAG